MLSPIEEMQWLVDNPAFEERPATIEEFLGLGYLNIAKGIRTGMHDGLVELFGENVNPYRIARYEEAMFTGAIGVGKSTFASIVTPYMVHWVMCLKNPQDYYDLLPGSRIAFMQMSTSADQAREVIFGDILARIDNSEWFKTRFPRDMAFKRQIRFPQKEVWILPGDSSETAFEGYNILGGVLDEQDSHKITKDGRDFADVGFDTIDSRIRSRFQDRGLLVAIGQMKKSNGFAANKYKAMMANPKALVLRQTIWESFGWDKYMKPDGTRDSFWYNEEKKSIVPPLFAEVMSTEEKRDLIEIPVVYQSPFQTNPEKALRDLAGIPPTVESRFIGRIDLIDTARDKWHEMFEDTPSPVNSDEVNPAFEPWFTAPDKIPRIVHLDVAYSAKGDAFGMVMGHVEKMVQTEDGESSPFIVIDFLYRQLAPSGGEVFLPGVRQLIYDLRDNRGFRIKLISMDGFESVEMRQQLKKKGFKVNPHFSVDKTILPYIDLREAVNEERIAFPRYMTKLKRGDTELVEVLRKELRELQDMGNKIDHPSDGSKDVADGVAAVVHQLTGRRSYRRGGFQAKKVDQPTLPASFSWDGPSTTAGGRMAGLGASPDTNLGGLLRDPGAPPSFRR